MIRLDFRGYFFDSAKVINKTDKATRSVLARFGAYVRRTARRSIRKRKKPSAPGKPPSSHTGLLKKFIFFGYEPVKKSVVIGPARLTRKNQGEAPSLLEYGGSTTLKRGKKKQRVNIKARPFMGPAFEKEKPNIPKMWQNSIK